VLSNVSDREHQQANNRLRRLMASYRQVEMLLRLGEYQPGGDPITDCAVELNGPINAFLQQDLRVPVPLQTTLEALMQLTSQMPEC
jgi:type III secretion protein N (ATPase)